MTEDDYPTRLQFCRTFLEKERLDPQMIRKVLFTDESGFIRDGIINSHMWNEETPHAIIQGKHQRKFIVNVWMGLIRTTLIGPYHIHGNG